MKFRAGRILMLIFLSCACTRQERPEVPKRGYYEPWNSLEELFHEVQMSGIFPDSKTFVDCTPKGSPASILEAYRQAVGEDDFELQTFVLNHFHLPDSAPPGQPSTKPFEQHLLSQWDDLTRLSSQVRRPSTLIALPYQYVVPGGRFREIYYWDSYFSMIGLAVSGKKELIRSTLDNFAFLIDSVGFIPNGNRTYYLGRSQPPYFSLMVRLLMNLEGAEGGLKYLPHLQQEYHFWMAGADKLKAGTAIARVVQLPDGTILNRYWDSYDFPRPESYKEDVLLAADLPDEGKKALYRNLRAAAESGWDFSTRWFAEKSDFASIKTTDILPVDLNCLLHHLEYLLSELYLLVGEEDKANDFATLAASRQEAILKVFWNESLSAFTDYWWREQQLSEQLTLAGIYPLYFRLATELQARKQIRALDLYFEEAGGLLTTTIRSDQQWDAPNGWAPLQWLAIKGLEHYGETSLAQEWTTRWLSLNRKVYENTGKMMEKYNVVDTTLIAGGGEYSAQDGFGWTNGVALGLLAKDANY